MARWFRVLTAMNMLGVAVLLLAIAMPGLAAYALFWPHQSVELQLVPVAPPVRVVARAIETPVDVPPAFRAPDLAPSPWEILPDGRVRFRE